MAAPTAHVCMLVAASILCGTTVRAHHSFGAEYDAQRPVTVTGVVTKVEWTNPHCNFYVDVVDECGTVVNSSNAIRASTKTRSTGKRRSRTRRAHQAVGAADDDDAAGGNADRGERLQEQRGRGPLRAPAERRHRLHAPVVEQNPPANEPFHHD